MKKIFLLIAVLAMASFARAQQVDVCTKTYDGGSEMIVIKPTVENLVKLLAMDEKQFKAAMQKFKYVGQVEDGNVIAYWNGTNDNFAYAKCVNSFLLNKQTGEVHFAVGRDMVYPQGSVMALYRDLAPYHVDMPQPQGTPGRQAAPAQGGAEQAAPGQGGSGRRGRRGFGRGAFGGPRTETYVVKEDSVTYTFSIGAFPQFFYVSAKKEIAK